MVKELAKYSVDLKDFIPGEILEDVEKRNSSAGDWQLGEAEVCFEVIRQLHLGRGISRCP